MQYVRLFLLTVLLAWGSLSGYLTEAAGFRVVTTVGMVTDLVRNVAGERAVVEGLIGEGVDPHLYKPTRNDVVALSEADVVFYNGLSLEGKMTDLLARMNQRGKAVYAVSEVLRERSDFLLPSGLHHDPHVWMDVTAWSAVVGVVADSLAKYDPAHAAEYRANAAAYLTELRALDGYVREVIASIPEDRRVLVTAHDAFNYFGRAYGIEVRGIQGISTESEAGVRDIEDLLELLVARKIPAVFVETSVSDKNVRALVEGASSRGHPLAIGGSLFSDAMGPAGTYEGTYLGMLDHNATMIARGLGGSAPAGGRLGRLAAGKGGAHD